MSEWDRLLKVTCNDISVIHVYVTAHRCAGRLKKKWDLRSGSNRHRHFVVFPSKHWHGVILFTVIPRNRLISVAFYDAHEDMEDLLSSCTTGSHGGPTTNEWTNRGARTISLVAEFGFILFWGFRLLCFVSFGSEYLLNPSDPPLHVMQNILYQISHILKFHSQFYKVDLVKFFLFQEFNDLFYVDFQVCTKTCNVTLHPVDKLPHSQHNIKSSQSKLLYRSRG